MNKKGMNPELLVGIIALMAFLVVALVIVYPPIKDWMFGAGQTGQCQFSILLRTISKQMSFGFGEIPAECQMKRITVTDKEIDSYTSLAKNRIASYKAQNNPAQYNFPDTPQSEYNWALEKIVADEMVDCLNKGWRGRLNLEATGLPTDMFKELGAQMCILCTRIKFDQTAQNLFGQKNFTMKPWLDANVKESKTYYNLLTENTDPFYQAFVTYSQFDIRKPTAIVFIAGVEKKEGEFLTDGVGGVGIFNYETLTTDLGFTEYRGIGLDNKAFILIGPQGLAVWGLSSLGVIPKNINQTATSKCKVIIGD
ncbi:Uncharacterised protein [uncultured archaeon]|nr:Uncharacterised protein [uncultured archaeon]